MSAKYVRVLLIEDNPGDARLIREMLAEGGDASFHLEHVDRLSAGLECVAEGGVDIVLLDLGLPDSQGFATFTQFHRQAPGVPLVVLSGLQDEALAIETVQNGAQDYLVKGQVYGNLLVRATRYAIERKRAEERLAQESYLNNTLMEHVPDNIYFKDTDSRFIRINSALARYLA